MLQDDLFFCNKLSYIFLRLLLYYSARVYKICQHRSQECNSLSGIHPRKVTLLGIVQVEPPLLLGTINLQLFERRDNRDRNELTTSCQQLLDIYEK